MAEDATSKAASGEAMAGSIAFYEKQRQHLKDLIARRRICEKRLAVLEDSIYQNEGEYLDSTPGGNIIVGFDNYTKGLSGAAALRRRTGVADQNRVFSRSSISYNQNNQDSQTPSSTLAASHGPTPISASFNKDTAAASGAPTPTSATGSKGTTKKKRANAAEDSETDTKETQKIRHSFGAVRK